MGIKHHNFIDRDNEYAAVRTMYLWRQVGIYVLKAFLYKSGNIWCFLVTKVYISLNVYSDHFSEQLLCKC